MNRYHIETEYGRFIVEAAEMTTEYDKEGGFDYVIAFDENGQAVAYYKRVRWWMLISDKNKMKVTEDDLK